MMIKNVSTNEISLGEWNHKIKISDDEWLVRQYYGLAFIVNAMDKSIEIIYHELKFEKGTIHDDVYKKDILPLENEMMDVDIQLVDVEDEMEKRGLDALRFEDYFMEG